MTRLTRWLAAGFTLLILVPALIVSISMIKLVQIWDDHLA